MGDKGELGKRYAPTGVTRPMSGWRPIRVENVETALKTGRPVQWVIKCDIVQIEYTSPA